MSLFEILLQTPNSFFICWFSGKSGRSLAPELHHPFPLPTPHNFSVIFFLTKCPVHSLTHLAWTRSELLPIHCLFPKFLALSFPLTLCSITVSCPSILPGMWDYAENVQFMHTYVNLSASSEMSEREQCLKPSATGIHSRNFCHSYMRKHWNMVQRLLVYLHCPLWPLIRALRTACTVSSEENTWCFCFL